MTAQIQHDKMIDAISKNSDHKTFERIQQLEPTINWLDFAAKLYKKSQSVNTITSFCKGVLKFREMLQADGKTVAQIVDEIKVNQNKPVYKVLDDFSTWCAVHKGYSARTVNNYMTGVRRLLVYLDIDIDDNKFADKVTMPKKRAIKDEYPDNATIIRIMNAAGLVIRGYLQTMCDTGLEPTDTAQLKPKYYKFDEDPVRVKIDREKTGEEIETFISKDTADLTKQIIAHKHIGPDDYIFVKGNEFCDTKVKQVRNMYNWAVAKAGFGKIIRKGRNYSFQLEKIDGHRFGKYHLKVYKKRWFSIAISTVGVPEYVAMAMLGRKQYLDEYNRQPLEKRQEFARKILKAVDIYADKQDKKEVVDKAAQLLGIDPSILDEAKMNQLKGIIQGFAKLPLDKIEQIGKLLGK